jgi:membrane-associated phospholipid phosphatase
MLESIQPWDNEVLHAVQNFFPAWSNPFFDVVTFLGNPVFWLLIATLLYWSHREKSAFFLINLLLFVSAATGILKAIVARPRPSPTEFRVSSESDWMKKLAQGFDFSFPSGHATTISGIVSYYSGKYKRTLLLFLGIIALVLVCLSRLVLGLHFLSDVIVGIVLGLVIGKIVWKAQQVLENHHFQLTKMKAEAGLVIAILLALLLALFWEKPALVAVLLGFYAGFFWGKEIGLKQSPVHHSVHVVKLVLGLIALGIILLPALVWLNGWYQYGLFFLGGLWVSFLYPWLFEKAVRQPTKIDISYQRPRK